jgi:hypothetical protein
MDELGAYNTMPTRAYFYLSEQQQNLLRSSQPQPKPQGHVPGVGIRLGNYYPKESQQAEDVVLQHDDDDDDCMEMDADDEEDDAAPSYHEIQQEEQQPTSSSSLPAEMLITPKKLPQEMNISPRSRSRSNSQLVSLFYCFYLFISVKILFLFCFVRRKLLNKNKKKWKKLDYLFIVKFFYKNLHQDIINVMYKPLLILIL